MNYLSSFLSRIFVASISLAVVFSIMSSVQAVSFSDLDFTHDYYQSIEYLVDKNILQGNPDGSFRPDDSINRAEFTKIIVESAQEEESQKFSVEGSHCFPDVKDEWFAKYVCSAKEQGIIKGYPDGLFHPTRTIEFAEAAKMIMIAMTDEEFEADEVWFRPYVDKMSEWKITPPSIRSISKNITRAEMAELIGRGWIKDPYRKNIAFFDLHLTPVAVLQLPSEYSIANGEVLYMHLKMPEADAATFESFPEDGQHHYAKDKNFVYYSQDVTGIDPDSFEYLFDGYVRDKDHVYRGKLRKAITDPASFREIDGLYQRDNINIYYLADVIDDADLDSFVVLDEDSSYAKDVNAVYRNGKKVDKLDAASFQYFDFQISKDKNHVYFKDGNDFDPVELSGHTIDPQSFTNIIIEGYDRCPIGRFYWKDTNNAYVFDPDTDKFEVILDIRPEGFVAKCDFRLYGDSSKGFWYNPHSYEPSMEFYPEIDFNSFEILGVTENETLIWKDINGFWEHDRNETPAFWKVEDPEYYDIDSVINPEELKRPSPSPESLIF